MASLPRILGTKSYHDDVAPSFQDATTMHLTMSSTMSNAPATQELKNKNKKTKIFKTQNVEFKILNRQVKKENAILKTKNPELWEEVAKLSNESKKHLNLVRKWYIEKFYGL